MCQLVLDTNEVLTLIISAHLVENKQMVALNGSWSAPISPLKMNLSVLPTLKRECFEPSLDISGDAAANQPASATSKHGKDKVVLAQIN